MPLSEAKELCCTLELLTGLLRKEKIRAAWAEFLPRPAAAAKKDELRVNWNFWRRAKFLLTGRHGVGKITTNQKSLLSRFREAAKGEHTSRFLTLVGKPSLTVRGQEGFYYGENQHILLETFYMYL